MVASFQNLSYFLKLNCIVYRRVAYKNLVLVAEVSGACRVVGGQIQRFSHKIFRKNIKISENPTILKK